MTGASEMDLSTLTMVTEKIPYHDKHCMTNLMGAWSNNPPFQQKKILINLHITLSSLLLVEAFLKSGAELYVTCTEQLVCHSPVKEILSKMGCFVNPEQLSQFPQDHFDVILDCGAYLADVFKPRFGFVELTQVNPKRYDKYDTRILNIDSSFVKQIETCFGTGNGFVRAIKVVCNEMSLDFMQLCFLIFGFGKVGKGIYNCLHKAGIPKEQLIVAEISLSCINATKDQDIKIFDLKSEKQALLRLIQSGDVDCAVTATGIVDTISKHFNHDDFRQVKILSNMGTDDEWGSAFSHDHVYYAKRPINFMLEHPTLIKYLDPIFTLYALAVEELITSVGRETKKIFYPSMDLQQRVLSTWLDQNSEYSVDVHKLWRENFPSHLDSIFGSKSE